MTQFPLRPSINAMINAQGSTLPIATLLRGYELPDPGVVVLYAIQPSARAGMECKAAVNVSREAIEDRGEAEAVGEALKMLRDRAMHRSLPLAHVGEPAPLMAVVASSEVEIHDPPTRFDRVY